jgi:peptidoglycan/LPS O-acetylase OafA/YrhL
MDSLLLGVLLGYWHYFNPSALYGWVRRWRGALPIVAAVAFVPSMFWPLMTTPWLYTVGYLYVALGAAALLLYFLDTGVGSGPLVRACAYIGSHSYSIYLWHACVGLLADAFLIRHLHLPLLLHHAVCVIGSIVLGIVMANLIEIPVLHVRDRIFPSRSRALEAREDKASSEAPKELTASAPPH